MSSLKCPHCGLTNFATAPACKRCKAPFNADAADSAPMESQPTAGFYQPRPEYNPNYSAGVWRDGKLLVTMKDTTLPNRCIKCNAPAMKVLKRKVEWYPRYVIVVFLLIRIVGLILYFCLRKRATIYVGLCEEHINKRRSGMLVGGSMMVIGAFMFLGGISNENAGVFILGLLLGLAGLVILVTVYRTVTATKIQEPYVWVKGVHQDFLNSLPAA